ncbi:hypothetical protein [Microtetraspora niveoalba]|uniref:hypothetical protein n=1 Tax=Microtetraspora niveoalba TaxID=46175 RepID=UPI000AEF6DFE|nr:hypothetical protein [Microtetraspora niveoalba]
MRRTTVVLVILALGTSASASSHTAGTPRASSPVRAEIAEPAAVSPGACPGVPRQADQLRPVTVRGSRWRLVSLDDSRGYLDGGTITPDGTLWALHGTPDAMGDHLVARRWDGRTWTQLPRVPSAPGADQALAAASRDVAWIVTHPRGEGDTYAPRTLSAWNGTAWQTVPLHLRPGPDDPHSSAQGPWVVAGDQSMRWDGTRWRSAPLPAPGYSVGGTDDEPWVVGEMPLGGTGGERTRVARWTGSAWQDVPMPDLRLPSDAEPEHGNVGTRHVEAAVRTGPAEFWALGSFEWVEHDAEEGEDVFPRRPLAMRNVSGVWTCFWGPTAEPGSGDAMPGFGDAAPDGRGGLWSTTGRYDSERGSLWHLSGGRWTLEFIPVPDGGHAVVYDLVSRDRTIYALGSIFKDAGTSAGRAALWRLSQ